MRYRQILLFVLMQFLAGCYSINYVPSGMQVPSVDTAGQVAVSGYLGLGAFEMGQAGMGVTATPWKRLVVSFQGSGYSTGDANDDTLAEFGSPLSFLPVIRPQGTPPDKLYYNYHLVRRGNSWGFGAGWMFDSRDLGKVLVTGGINSEFASRSLKQGVLIDSSKVQSLNFFYASTYSLQYWVQAAARVPTSSLIGKTGRRYCLLSARLSYWQVLEKHTDFWHAYGPETQFATEYVKWPATPHVLPEFLIGYEAAFPRATFQVTSTAAFASPVHNWLAPPFLSIRLGLTYRFPVKLH